LDGVGDAERVDVDGVGSPPVSWFARSAQIVPPSTSSSRTMSAMSGHVHALRFFFSGSSVSTSVSSTTPPAGSSCVAAAVPTPDVIS
jgi:hypothetical protein